MRITFLVTISSIFYTVTSLADYTQEAEEVAQECYSCSGDSALCRNEVYDGTYLTKSLCRTKCFVRREANNIYRGCFDGWLGGLVKYNYEGCRIQQYLGQQVEWCFCRGSNNLDEQPCNYISPRDMGSQLPDMSYTRENEVDVRFEEQSDYSSFQGVPVPDYKQFMNYAMGGKASSSSKIEAKEGPAIRPQKYKLPDLPQELGFPPLQPMQHHDHPCAIENSGSIYDPRDCSKYYLCSNGIPYHMDCPDGTVWNQRLRGCAFTFDPEHPCEIRPPKQRLEYNSNHISSNNQESRGYGDDYNSVVYKDEEAETYKGEKYYVESGGQKNYQQQEEAYIEESIDPVTTEMPY